MVDLITFPSHPIFLLIPVLIWYLYSLLYRTRFQRLKDVPQGPSSLLYGHLKFIGETLKEVKAFGAGGYNHPGKYYLTLRYD
jgi:hypothetical protein